ncbi:MAG: sigma-70 family RNA polymerase sigma factor [Alphaproteobacteria bacterium]
MTSSALSQDVDASWSDLAIKAQQGDKRAYHRLLTEIAPFIRICISGKLANPDWVDEVVQDVLISVHKSLRTYAADRPFKPWLNAIIQFRKTDFLRKHYRGRKVREAGVQDAEVFNSYVTFSAHSGELKDIEAALDRLPEKQRQIFTLLKVEGYSIKEVAKKMDMTESAVKVSAHRTGLKLRDMLEEYE